MTPKFKKLDEVIVDGSATGYGDLQGYIMDVDLSDIYPEPHYSVSVLCDQTRGVFVAEKFIRLKIRKDLTECTSCDRELPDESIRYDSGDNPFCPECWAELAPVMAAEYRESLLSGVFQAYKPEVHFQRLGKAGSDSYFFGKALKEAFCDLNQKKEEILNKKLNQNGFPPLSEFLKSERFPKISIVEYKDWSYYFADNGTIEGLFLCAFRYIFDNSMENKNHSVSSAIVLEIQDKDYPSAISFEMSHK